MRNNAAGRKWLTALGGASEKGRPVSRHSGRAERPGKSVAASGTIAADRKRREPKLSPCKGGRNWELHHKGLHRWATGGYFCELCRSVFCYNGFRWMLRG